jgi:hypothetical protein
MNESQETGRDEVRGHIYVELKKYPKYPWDTGLWLRQFLEDRQGCL